MNTITKYFQKISGYKVIGKCRNCGTRLVTQTETQYCEPCLKKLKAFREKQDE